MAEKKDINLLTEEDRFLLQLSRVERLQTKLAIMSYMGNFMDNLHLIAPVSCDTIRAECELRPETSTTIECGIFTTLGYRRFKP